MADTKAAEFLICDCDEKRKLSPDDAQVMHVLSPRAERDWVACKGNVVCHQKVQEKIAAAHNHVEESVVPSVVPAPPVVETKIEDESAEP
jgi:hypothetical protein